MTRYRTVDTPVGRLLLSGPDARTLSGIWFEPHRGAPAAQSGWVRDQGAHSEAAAQLLEWFSGERTSFDLDLRPAGTPFQLRVWTALLSIPFGETRSYSSVAAALGTSARAVGSANARNPLSIVIPCHRLVGAAGDLTGYAGGVERKRWLLGHEAAMAGKVGYPSLRT